MRRYEDNDVLQVPPPKAVTEAERQKARLTIVERCPEDARLLLEMLGLAS
jgi:hypothetical protein